MTVDTYLQRYYAVDSTDPARTMYCEDPSSCSVVRRYGRLEGRPELRVRLFDDAVRATGWFDGHFGEERMRATVLAAWRFVPAKLALTTADLEMIEGGEHALVFGFAAESLDARAPRRGLRSRDVVDSALARASVIVEATIDSVTMEITYVDGVPTRSRQWYTASIDKVWRGLAPRTIKVATFQREMFAFEELGSDRATRPFRGDSLYLLYLALPETAGPAPSTRSSGPQFDQSGLFRAIRAVHGPGLAAERSRIVPSNGGLDH